MIKQAVILSGGRGERLRPLTDDLPKPLAPVNGIPFLDYLIESIVQVGIKRILLLVGYRGDMIIDRYRSSIYSDDVHIDFSVGGLEDQTGSRVLHAYESLDSTFLLLYGDNYWPIEYESMINLYSKKEADVMTTVFSNRHGTGEYGSQNNILVGVDGLVERYDKTRRSENLTGVDIGYFIVAKHVLDPRLEENVSFEEDILPKLISERKLAAYVTNTQYYYITNMQSLNAFEVHAKVNGIQHISLSDKFGLFQ